MKRQAYFAIAAPVLAAGILIGYLGTRPAGAAPPQDAAADAIPKPSELSGTFATLAKRLQPSVVTITSTIGQRAAIRPRRGTRGEPSNPDEMLRRFFGGGGG